MINFTSTKVFLFIHKTDLRKSFDTLGALVREASMDPASGDIFVFTNLNRNRIKILVWEKDGFWVLSKRLEQGQFLIPLSENEGKYNLQINMVELKLLLDGYQINNLKKSQRYSA